MNGKELINEFRFGGIGGGLSQAQFDMCSLGARFPFGELRMILLRLASLTSSVGKLCSAWGVLVPCILFYNTPQRECSTIGGGVLIRHSPQTPTIASWVGTFEKGLYDNMLHIT